MGECTYAIGEKSGRVAEARCGGYQDDGLVVIWLLILLEVRDGDSCEVEGADEVHIEDDVVGRLYVECQLLP